MSNVLNAPKDKLLVYNLKEGWESLCKFLDKPVPDQQFPYANIGGKLFNELMQKMVKEAFVTISLLIGFGVFGLYKFFRLKSYTRSKHLLVNFGA
ncbi:unnamed protein product [Clavelina lepadiformis]|uniref:Uncharacterized protein n=1 Tax=Clavelina lepadiformis TaxID=159417 RepID=A0ABP0FKN6_CLALP